MSTGTREGMSLIVKTVTRWLKRLILVFGCYIVCYGHLTPGGGFSGGVIVACAFILLTLAEGQRFALRTLSKAAASALDCVGALLFLGMALAGLGRTGTFFKNFITTPPAAYFRLLSSGIILWCNLAIGLKVGMALLVVFTVLAATHVALRGGERKLIHRGRE